MPIEWPIGREDDHVGIADSRFTSQYDAMPQLKSLAAIWAERIQLLENAAYSLMVERWLDDAEGVQLDRLGAVVGESRLDRLDDTYRQAIRGRIVVNRGSGDAQTLIAYIEESSGVGQGGDIRITESMPATWVIHIGVPIRQGYASQMSALAAAGVGAYLTSSEGALPFGQKETDAADPVDVGGIPDYQIVFTSVLELDTGETLALENGDLLEILRTAEPPESPFDGPRLAENYRVSL